MRSRRLTPAASNLLILEAVGDAGGEVPARAPLGERARRRVALQAPPFERADDQPMAAEVIAAFDARGDEQQAAARGVVVGAHRLRVRPGRLREHAGLDSMV